MNMTLSKIADAVGPDTAQEISIRILTLKPVRHLPRPDASSVGEAWFCILDNIGIRQPDHYVSRLARQVRTKRDQADAEQRVIAKRRLLDLKPPKRRYTGGASSPEWTEPKALGTLSTTGLLKHDSALEEVERRDDSRTLYEEIRRLPPKDQMLIEEVYWKDQPQSAIARERGQSPSAVRSRLDRIRDQLGISLEKRWGGRP